MAETKTEEITYITEGIKGDYTLYKGKPLVRNGGQYCYGDLSDEYFLEILVLTTKKVGTEEIPDVCFVNVNSTKDGSNVKQLQKNGLFAALDDGIYWLDQFLGKQS